MRIYRFVAKMAEVGKRLPLRKPSSATSATDAALGLRPRRALSSAQLLAEWNTSTSRRNVSSLNRTSDPWSRTKGLESVAVGFESFVIEVIKSSFLVLRDGECPQNLLREARSLQTRDDK
jgi:hypothetical protein